jgi:hypothetical protein
MNKSLQLNEWLTLRANRPFCWQAWNCAIMALDWMLFSIGREPPTIATSYASAHRRIAAEGGLANVCDRYLDDYSVDVARPSAALAMTGDVVGVGNKSVAIVGILAGGGQIIVPTAQGLTVRMYQPSKYRQIWRAL